MKEWSGGRMSGGRSFEPEPRKRPCKPPKKISLFAAEVTLAADLQMIAASISSATRGAKKAAGEADETPMYNTVPFRMERMNLSLFERCDIQYAQIPHPENNAWTVHVEVAPAEMLRFLQSDPVKDLMKKCKKYEDQKKNTHPQFEVEKVTPLSARLRASFVDLGAFCQKVLDASPQAAEGATLPKRPFKVLDLDSSMRPSQPNLECH